jgi:hypothetical protein
LVLLVGGLSRSSSAAFRVQGLVRRLSDQVGERIAAAMAGLPAAEVVTLNAVKIK